MSGIDRHLQRLVVEHRVGALDPLFQLLSWVGSFGLLWIVVAGLLAMTRRAPGILLTTTIAVVAADLASLGIKVLTGRRRPFVDDPDPAPLVHTASTLSFPSGHAATSFAGALVLSVAAPRWRYAFFVVAAAIAASRVYVGVHYPGDVIVGAALGAAVATTALLLLRAVRRRRPPAPLQG